MIDMQRDFLEPGGFGAALGNDVSRLAPAVAPAARLIAAFRRHGFPVIHTREAHRPDLSDCPPAKRTRGGAALRIGDVGPMGRILVAGEPGDDIVPALAPAPGEIVIDKPGKGAFYATRLGDVLPSAASRISSSAASPPRCACKRRCARRTTAATNVCSSRMRRKAISPSSRPRPWRWCAPRARIVGWTATADQVIAALAQSGAKRG